MEVSRYEIMKIVFQTNDRSRNEKCHVTIRPRYPAGFLAGFKAESSSIFFFNFHHQPDQLSDQELAGYTAGFCEYVSRAKILKKLRIIEFMGNFWKIHNLHFESPKLENLVPLETSSKVLKVLRIHFSMIPNGRYSKIGSKSLF